MVSTATKPAFGTGIYSFPLASKLVRGASSRQLRYWMKTGLTPSTFGRGARGSAVLSFHDVISLEIVKRFRDVGVSLQKVRMLEQEMQRLHPDVPRPFATESFFTDGASIWYRRHPEDEGVVELVGQRAGLIAKQAAWANAVQSFAQEITYEHGVAARWDLGRYLHADPEIHFGEPVIRGTRVTATTIQANLEVASVDEVAEWFGVSPDAVREAAAFSAA